ncbi:hypothetical protein [Paenibacillus dauci]|uniref:hypothetical protein n=1 Tax=Paenibacillus dauci TaxID=1567106 RepID=UPI0006194EC2|nr:hypothetical protein [Paenibacillus dauci]
MVSGIVRKKMITAIVGLLLFSSMCIYIKIHMGESSKTVFEHQVNNYIHEKYSDLIIIKQDTRYSLIDMKYHSTVHTQKGNKIEVNVGYGNKLEDNYNK